MDEEQEDVDPVPRTLTPRDGDGPDYRLVLSGGGLKKIPKALTSKTRAADVTALFLDHNDITKVPKSFARFTSLVHLDLQYNGIEVLSPTLFQLTTLKKLELSHNKIEILPPEIAQLKLLESLRLTDNLIRKIPSAQVLSQLSNLQVVRINKNRLDLATLSTEQVWYLNATAWGYGDQKTAQEIVPGVLLGSISSAHDKEELQRCKVTHILSVCPRHPMFLGDFVYKVMRLADVPWEPLSQHFGDMFSFMDEAVSSGGRVLVHCLAGVSRSATTVAYYIMRKRKVRVEDALQVIRTKRPVISPNIGFMDQLAKYEDTLFPPKKSRRKKQSVQREDDDAGSSSS